MKATEETRIKGIKYIRADKVDAYIDLLKDEIKELDEELDFYKFDNNRLSKKVSSYEHWMIGLWILVIAQALIIIF
jgi:cell division septum initiation protein DivIVA